MAVFISLIEGGRVAGVYDEAVYKPIPVEYEDRGVVVGETTTSGEGGEPVVQPVTELVPVPIRWERHPAIPADAIEVGEADAERLASGPGPWRWTGTAIEPWIAPGPSLEAAQADAVARVRAYAAEARQRLSGAGDPYKAAVYNQRAGYGRAIVADAERAAGDTSPRRSTAAMEAVARSEAVRTGMAATLEAADPVAMARVWVAMDERLAGLAAEMDMTETQIIAAVGRRRSVEGVAEALAQALAAAEARLAAVMTGG